MTRTELKKINANYAEALTIVGTDCYDDAIQNGRSIKPMGALNLKETNRLRALANRVKVVSHRLAVIDPVTLETRYQQPTFETRYHFLAPEVK